MAREDDVEPLQPLLDRLAGDDDSAIDLLIEHSVRRMHRLAHFMLKEKPHVRRWYETGDVAQAAALRLTRALKAVKPATPRDFINLAALQIRRELSDLARHEFGPEGPGAHHISRPVKPGGDDADEQADLQEAAEGPGPATQAAWRDLLQHVQNSLPPKEREVFDLLYVQGLTQEEAATILGVATISVKRTWRSARLLLHEAGHLNGGANE